MNRSEKFGPNAWLVEEMYARYREDPASVSGTWRDFFADYPDGSQAAPAARPVAAPAPAGPKPSAAPGPSQGASSTLVRVIPAKLLEVNLRILNNHLGRSHAGRVRYTQVIAWAVNHALVSLGLGARNGNQLTLGLLLGELAGSGHAAVPLAIEGAGGLNFQDFYRRYEDLVRKARAGEELPGASAAGVLIAETSAWSSYQSLPGLSGGHFLVMRIGSVDYPAEYRGADKEFLAEMGVGKVVGLTCTFDPAVVDESSADELLQRVNNLLLGGEMFYENIFTSAGVPYVPVQWRVDVHPARDSVEAEEKQAQIFQLINQYRVRGHLIATLDPLEAKPVRMHPELDPATYGFTIWDLDRKFVTGGLAGKSRLPLGEILAILRDAYCRTVGVEYMHISEPDEKRWIRERVEGVPSDLSTEDQLRILERLNEAEAFEAFLHRKYVGHKRFSLEGAEAMIPMLDGILEMAIAASVEEVVLGMAHRGRLNVLANVVGKSHRQIFKEFEGDIDPQTVHGSGDVKYHVGAEGTYRDREGRECAITLVSNPSHLESVDPVVEGVARARQDAAGEDGRHRILPLLIHGDGAFAGQGVVAETLNFSQIRGYRTGGSIHIIVNNQLGFTTGPGRARSSIYATDMAKAIQAPIFHVNGDDPEACVRVARLAFAFRRRFQKDVVIDMWCYRRWGHNEADDPAFTQPMMYRKISGHRSVRKRYTEALLHRGDISVERAEKALESFSRHLQEAFDSTGDATDPGKKGKYLRPIGVLPTIDTAVALPMAEKILESLAEVPRGLHLHSKLKKWLADRATALQRDSFDWALGEALAFGSLLLEGKSLRVAGEDTRRGTFSQRHAVWVDQQTGEEYFPFSNLAPEGTSFAIYDSTLSEFAALGFEYGYSVAAPEKLVVWEAQFGDFANGAQVIIDNFVSAGEDKWGQPSGLVMLLPHGYEGQGPEHSSSRLERYLQLGAQGNIQVAVPSTPAQYFHLLRRQAISGIRRPLVVLTPKSLLRLPAARSGAADFTEGRFRAVLRDRLGPAPAEARRVLLCSGKVYYDLHAAREKMGRHDTAILRVEQLYPFPAAEVAEELAHFGDAEVLWVQEEPENMGAWRFMWHHCLEQLGFRLTGVTRKESASPATGAASAHEREQQSLVSRALAG